MKSLVWVDTEWGGEWKVWGIFRPEDMGPPRGQTLTYTFYDEVSHG